MNSNSKLNYFLGLCFFSLAFLSANGQTPERQQLQQLQELRKDQQIRLFELDEDRQTPASIQFETTAKATYTQADIPALLGRVLALRPGVDELKLIKRDRHLEDIRINRFQQYFQQVKVEHGQYVALAKGDRPASLSGAFYSLDQQLKTQPTLDEKAALRLALQSIGARQYMWEAVDQYRNGINAPRIAAELNRAYNSYFPQGELVIVDDYDTPELDLDLAYKFNIYASEPLSRDYVYVNAHTGKIMLKDAIIKHAQADVQTRYNGTQMIGTSLVTELSLDPFSLGSTEHYVLWDQERGSGIRTYDMNAVGGLPLSIPLLYEAAVDFVDDDNNWTLAEHQRDPAPTLEEAINDDIAWDAHWGAAMVYDYWKERHNRLSYDGDDAAIDSYVHYGEGYDNAFWNGSAMTYGDGSYKNTGLVEVPGFSPLTSMDVCAHEIGHGVCEFTSNLVYQRESGAMNEGFSDIWAAAVEAYIQERFSSQSFDYNVWGIGEQIDQRDGFNNLDQALRWMDDPKREGDPDTYGGAGWTNPECGEPTLANDYCGVHTNSGVLNKWFYLLTAGSGTAPDDGVNDLGDAYSVNGLGFGKSELIAFGTEVQLTPNATFAEARAASIAYTRAVYGPCSDEEESVTNAWYAVGVGPAFGCSNEASSGFLVTQASVNEAVMDAAGCGAEKTVTVSLFVSGTDGFDLALSGTATEGADYFVDNTTIASSGNGFSTQVITITVLDDATEEGDETIILSIPAGSGSAPGADTYTLTIRDDDVAPIIGIGPKSLLFERFLTTEMPDSWAVVENIASSNQWYFGSYQGSAYISLTGELPNYEGNTAACDIILRTPLIDARGLTSVDLSFDWTAGGETDVALQEAALFDYANLVYSFDGERFFDLEDVFVGDNFGLTPASGAYSVDLSETLANQQFYIGWRWRNDALLSSAYSFTVDNVRVNGDTRQVESELLHSSEAPLGPFETAYFYSLEDKQLIAAVTNNTGHDFGCTSLSIERSGSGAASWMNGGSATEKAIRFNAENTTRKADLDISLYYTEAEMSGWEQASGLSRDALVMNNTKAGAIGDATKGNTSSGATTYTPIYKSGNTLIAGSFSASIQGSIGSLVLAAEDSGSSLIRPDAFTTAHGNNEFKVYPNPSRGQSTVELPEWTGTETAELKLMDLQGRILQRQAIPAGTYSIQLNANNVPAGMYWISLQTGDETYTRKWIKE
ncbi:M4 family metallopeptidase [Flavilitoribacter nigricans]|uniref:T9SS type A sorting domain-containing protein n=1 Tax=Flavilitoribacter nigricans (strain ATCC 23147 / DSM 23189 / NBRC 102662 / NCIMB 1420 / SS-2) TaxID=1122177 RepID=A0A2D0NF95_FLAN2|nr:M4 family metallopeptidase [Flavilitoribacter nigricans]PHN07078.1 hypothetical protein CRP01_07550 [Flavilitoribacter nigricans DSM 23189 = NBRC 102662]